jgi:hypothetical protein
MNVAMKTGSESIEVYSQGYQKKRKDLRILICIVVKLTQLFKFKINPTKLMILLVSHKSQVK